MGSVGQDILHPLSWAAQGPSLESHEDATLLPDDEKTQWPAMGRERLYPLRDLRQVCLHNWGKRSRHVRLNPDVREGSDFVGQQHSQQVLRAPVVIVRPLRKSCQGAEKPVLQLQWAAEKSLPSFRITPKLHLVRDFHEARIIAHDFEPISTAIEIPAKNKVPVLTDENVGHRLGETPMKLV